MITLRKSTERGTTKIGWLDSAHTFSFGHYYDPNHMGFSDLRVINDDRVIPGAGFGTHGHRDMEIITYVLDGALEHKDSMGNGSVIRSGDVQRMSAGTGVMHSEYNHSKSEPVRFLQIWFLPDQQGYAPGYEQKRFESNEKRGVLRLVASKDGRDGSVSLNQDVNMYAGLFNADQSHQFQQVDGRQTWLHVARGSVEVNGRQLSDGDGLAFIGKGELTLQNGQDAEVILFDLKKSA